MRHILFILLFISNAAAAQDVCQFAFWKPKDKYGFEAGYTRHLEWHKANRDTWNWYGWFIVSGPRYGMFVDATFNHRWTDFDNAVNPAGDRADNELNVEPYADFNMLQRYLYLPEYSDTVNLQSKFLRMITVRVTDLDVAIKRIRKSKGAAMYQLIDGGESSLVLLIGCDSFGQFKENERLTQFLQGPGVKSVTSETLVFRSDLSLIYKPKDLIIFR
jgi:hypothetical protein